jgi:hypothetical protein
MNINRAIFQMDNKQTFIFSIFLKHVKSERENIYMRNSTYASMQVSKLPAISNTRKLPQPMQDANECISNTGRSCTHINQSLTHISFEKMNMILL